jgi:predicted phosphodiesterase
MDNSKHLRDIKEYIATHPTAGYRTVAKAVGVPPTTVQSILKKLGYASGNVSPKMPEVPKEGVRYDQENGVADVVSRNPQTLEQLLKACKVDLKQWRVERWVANKWETASKHPDTGKVTRTPLYQIKAFLEKIPGIGELDVIKEAVEYIRRIPLVKVDPPMIWKARDMSVEDPVMLEISIPDLHLGRLSWGVETGEDYDTSIAEDLYMKATKELWLRASIFPVQKIMLVVGNDLLNSDNSREETTAGTPMSEDSRWQRTFKRGVALVRNQVEYLRGRCPGGVEVVVVQGNHDMERSHYLGAVIEAVYEKTQDVKVDNSPRKRKYKQWGTVMLGLTHGDKINHAKLPLIAAAEAPQIWASTTCRHIHLGHLHHKKETQFHSGSEHSAVRVTVLPSLAATDPYHYDHGYTGTKRAAEAYLWGKKKGYLGHLSWTAE